MPFPLAHPAAVVPLRRWCPAYFDLASLVIGSLVPDLACSIDDWEYFSHTLLGSLVFCLPVGLVAVWVFHRVRIALVTSLPNPHRGALLPLCTAKFPSPQTVILSLLVGSWLHILWDLFTHGHSWLVRSIPLFSLSIGPLRLNQILWLLSSFAGMAVLLSGYASLIRKSRCKSPSSNARVEGWAYARVCGVLVLPFAGAVPLALHDPGYSSDNLVRYVAMYYGGCAFITLALVGFFLKSRRSVGDRE